MVVIFPYNLEIDIKLNSPDIDNLTPEDITFTFGPASLEEELKTWDNLFGIEERYKVKCCSADAKYWITQIIEESNSYDKSASEILSVNLDIAQRNPYSQNNFLRKPFLEACAALNIFT